MHLYIEHMDQSRLQELVGKQIRYFVRWSQDERFGTVTRVGPQTIWCGAWCYHRNDMRHVREVTA